MYISLDAFWPSASNGKSVLKQKHTYDFIQFMCMYILCRYIRLLTVINTVFDEYIIYYFWWVLFSKNIYQFLQTIIKLLNIARSDIYFSEYKDSTRQLEIGTRWHTHVHTIYTYTIRICIGHTRSPPSLSPQQCVRYYHHTFEYYRKIS